MKSSFLSASILMIIGSLQVADGCDCISQTVEEAFTNAELVFDGVVLSEREAIGYSVEEINARILDNEQKGLPKYSHIEFDKNGWVYTAYEYTIKLNKVYKGTVKCDTLKILSPFDRSNCAVYLKVGRKCKLYCNKYDNFVFAAKDSTTELIDKYKRRTFYWATQMCSYPNREYAAKEETILASLCKKNIPLSPCLEK